MNVDPLTPGTALSPLAAPSAATSYVIKHVLGMGGFGITYLAEWLGSEVAIKEYLPDDFAGRASDGLGVVPRTGKAGELFQFGLQRFEEEARTLLQLKDAPSIAKALNYFEANGTAYMVMDYVTGRTLEAVVIERGALPETELRKLLLSTLQSLAAVHERGYLHRDIKPSNIIVLPDGRPLLIDFGAARQALGAKTQLLTVMLSPGYAPFEQYNTSGSGPFTDLYALGATLYYCLLNGDRKQVTLTMSRAQAPDRVAALQRGAADPLTPAVQMGAGRYGVQFLEVLDWMLRIWPNQRPQTAAEVIARLQQPDATPDSDQARTVMSPRALAVTTPAPATTRLPRGLLIGLAAVVMLGTIVLIVSLIPSSLLRERREPARRAPVLENGQVNSSTVAANSPSATPRTVQLPSQATLLEGAQLDALLVRYGLFDRRSNPTGKGVVHRYRQQVAGDAVVVNDAATGLMWQKRASPSDQNTFQGTAAYIDELNRTRFAGYANWRVPTLPEAASLLEPEPTDNKYLDPIFTGGNFIWTADSSAPERGWVIYFYDGYAATEPITFNATVRAVRTLDGR